MSIFIIIIVIIQAIFQPVLFIAQYWNFHKAICWPGTVKYSVNFKMLLSGSYNKKKVQLLNRPGVAMAFL